MTTELVKTSKVIKSATSTVSSHLAAVGRAREIYLAQMKRAEAEYFDRIERATAIITGAVVEVPEPARQAAPVQAAVSPAN